MEGLLVFIIVGRRGEGPDGVAHGRIAFLWGRSHRSERQEGVRSSGRGKRTGIPSKKKRVRHAIWNRETPRLKTRKNIEGNGPAIAHLEMSDASTN